MSLSDDASPDVLLSGKIRLLQRIGHGGMAEVWVARNEATHAEIAVKIIEKSARTKVADERFRREARMSATTTHRNVVRIFDLIDEPDGTLGLVMELLRGSTLEACLKERGLVPGVHAVAVAVSVLSALQYVHQKGIVHRDLKPGNIFLAVEPDGHVIPKVLDFGIAKLPAAASALTMEGSVLGTPHYMSPEQIRGDEIDGRSDMFSFAIVLYEMLTGTCVFRRESAAGSLAAVLEQEVDPDPRIEPPLWLALQRALAKRPAERYATCSEFAEALRAAVDTNEEELARSLRELRSRTEGLPESSDSDAGVASSPSRRRRARGGQKRAWVIAGITSAAALVLATALAWSHGSAARADLGAATKGSATPSAATAALTMAAASVTGPSVARDAIPPPEPAPMIELSSTPSVEPPPTPPAAAAVHSPSATSSSRGPRGPVPDARAAATAKKGVATKPDF